jgi:hypothetical protein
MIAVVLVVTAAYLTAVPQPTPPVKKSVVISSNEVTLFPAGARFGNRFGNLSFVLWTLAVQNNSNETQSLIASPLLDGYPSGEFQNITVIPSQTYSQTICTYSGFGRKPNSNFTVSVFAVSKAGATNFTSLATKQKATQLSYNGQVSVNSSLRNISAITPGPGGSPSGQWNMTLKNEGAKPIAFFAAYLYGSNASSPITWVYSCFYYGATIPPRAVVSPESPLLQGQSTTISSPIFQQGVTAGETYQVYYIIGYSDNTEVVFTSSVQAR